MNTESRKNFRGKVGTDGARRLEALASMTGQSESWCVSLILEEGLKAFESFGYKVPLPVKLEVKPGEVSKAETPTPRPKSKAA